MPRVSILIPTHNRAENISDAVVSALAQTEKDIEVIVYDDGSDEMDGYFTKKGKTTKICDPTDKILSRIKDKRFKYYKNPENHGAAYSRNRLMEMATGEYSMWLDSDDVSNVWRVELCLKAIETYKTAYVRSAITIFGRKVGNTYMIPPLVVYRGGVSFATIMFPTCNKMKFDEGYVNCCEDMDWESRYAARYGRSVYIPLTLYGVGRCAQDRLTMRYKREQHKDQYAKDKARFDRCSARCSEEMNERGTTKMPMVVPWEFIESFQRPIYEDRYRKNMIDDPMY